MNARNVPLMIDNQPAMFQSLAANYRFWRNSPTPMPAATAYRKACDDCAHGITRSASFSKAALASYQNAPNDRGGRWIENPEGAGLRFVGWSDELRRTRNAHTGWFLHPEGDPAEVARGCVYQLPSRDGRPVYVEAIRMGEHAGEWRDMGEQGGALVFLNTRRMGEPGGTEAGGNYCTDAAWDAAHGADREAELFAERAREYNEAWQAGQRAGEELADAKAARVEARELVAAFRAELNGRNGRPLSPAIHALLRSGIRDVIRDGARAGERAKALRDEWGGFAGTYRAHLSEAFAAGMGE